MSIADFLFNGQAPKSIDTYGKTTQNLPQWFSDFQQGIAARGNELADQKYEAYGGPRIADFTPEQQQAFNQIKSTFGNESGAMKTAMNTAMKAGNGADASGAAAPWLQKAGQATYNTVDKYMDPYMDSVVDRIGDLGARNLQEKLMPAINSDFIRAGQYGSTGQMNEVGKALRDTQESVIAEQNRALSQGYSTALEAANADANRFGQIGQTAGNLSNMDSEMQLGGAKAAGALGQLTQDARYKDIDALGSVGNAKQDMGQANLDLAYKDFVEQRDYQQEQLSWLNNLVKGFQMPMQTMEQKTAPLAGAQFSGSPLSTALGTGLTTYNLLK